MKKVIIAFLMFMSIIAKGQTTISDEFKGLYKDYESYCSEMVTDSIEVTGYIKHHEVPIYNGANLLSYKIVYDTKDTVWGKYNCPKYSQIHGYMWKHLSGAVMCDTLGSFRFYNGKYIQQIIADKEVSKIVVCNVLREEPSMEGFFEWLYNRISK